MEDNPPTDDDLPPDEVEGEVSVPLEEADLPAIPSELDSREEVSCDMSVCLKEVIS